MDPSIGSLACASGYKKLSRRSLVSRTISQGVGSFPLADLFHANPCAAVLRDTIRLDHIVEIATTQHEVDQCSFELVSMGIRFQMEANWRS